MATTTPSGTGVSPTSSPRLPSPPPFTEVQFGPKSPGIGGSITELQLETPGLQDEGALRRIRPGSKATEMAKGPPFVQLDQVESPFQLQEYLSSMYHSLTRDEESSTTRPITKEMAIKLSHPPTAVDTGEVIDRNLWLYELCRFLCSRTTRMIVAFFADNPACSSQTCPEMRASEWQYLCAVHEPPKSCCAIDYCNHTLDWASNILTSPKHFPSRLSLGGEAGSTYQSMRQLTNIFRRVYRIYAHAWFQHREVFWAIEAELGLYLFFKTVCDVYQLIPEDNYTIPPEAEGEREESLQTPINDSGPQRIAILQKPIEQQSLEPAQGQTNATTTPGATTRRHKHTPSTGVPIAVIVEGTEEEDGLARTRTIHNRGVDQAKRISDVDRSSAPGRIAMPENNDPEGAPEDPTPVATYDTNPFGPAIDTSLEKHETVDEQPSIKPISRTDTANIASAVDPANQSRVQHPNEPAQDHTGFSPTKVEAAAQDVAIPLTTATPEAKETNDIKDIKDTEEDEGNETMERIEISPPVESASSTHTEATKVQAQAQAQAQDSDASDLAVRTAEPEIAQ